MSQSTSPEKSNQRGWLRSALRGVTFSILRQPKTTLIGVGLSCLFCLGLTLVYLDFKTKRSDLIDPTAPFHQRWLSYTENFGDDSDLVVVVEGNSPARIKQVLDDVGSQLQAQPEHFAKVLYKVDSTKLQQKGLYFLHPDQLAQGAKQLQKLSPALTGQWDSLTLENLLASYSQQLQSVSKEKRQQSAIDLHRLQFSLNRFLKESDDYHSPWPTIIETSPQLVQQKNQTTYLLNEAGTMGFIKAVPVYEKKGFEGAAPVITQLRNLLEVAQRQYPDVRLGLTGIPVLESDEMRQSQFDMITASCISFVGVGLLLFLGFRGIRHPVIALTMLAVGLMWSFGYTTLAIGHLNILSVSFAVIIIGLGVDFGIHFLTRYLQLRHEEQSLFASLVRTSDSVGPGIITAALTTALAFACATYTPFLGIAELGMIAGGGIVLCALATFLVIPAVVTLSDSSRFEESLPTPYAANRFRELIQQHPILIVILSLSVIAGTGVKAFAPTENGFKSQVEYDYNLLHLQAEGLESVETQKRIFQQASNSLLFAVSIAESPHDALKLKRKLEQLPSVLRVEELASHLPATSHLKTQPSVQAISDLLSNLPTQTPTLTYPSIPKLQTLFEKLDKQLKQQFSPKAILGTRKLIRENWKLLQEAPKLKQAEFVSRYQNLCLQALVIDLHQLKQVANSEPVSLADFPTALSSRFVSASGKWLLQIYPREQVWDIEPLTNFVNEVRSVDPKATGTPLQNFEAAEQISDSYQIAAYYSLAVIVLVLLIDFVAGHVKWQACLIPLALLGLAYLFIPEEISNFSPLFLIGSYVLMALTFALFLDFKNSGDALLALLPPLWGGLMMLGLMALFQINLNPANLIVLPLVLGIGVDDGVHVIHDYRNNQGRYKLSPSTVSAILLTSLTSMIGFGSMMIAAHRGLYSVGQVLVLGVGSCLFVSLITLPALLTLIDQLQNRTNLSDIEIPDNCDTIPFSSEVA